MTRASMLRLPVVVLATVLLGTSARPVAQPAADAGAARLRALFFQRDYETGAIEGAKLVVAAPNRSDLKAWYVLNLARADQDDEAVRLAQQMTADAPEDGWAWLALAAALNYQGSKAAEAADAAAKAVALMPDHADAIWIRAQTLANDPKRREEAIAFVDTHRARVRNPAEILATRGYALYVLSSGPPRDEAKLKAALDAFEEARRADPTNVNAHYLPGSYLDGLRRTDGAIPLLKKALALAPGSVGVHQALWRALLGSREMSAEQKRQDVLSDLTAFLARHGDRPAALLAVALTAREIKAPDQQRASETKILEKFSDSPQAEWVLVYRWREYASTQEGARKPEFRQMLRDYVARPKHYHEGLLGEAYRNLFFLLLEDKEVPGDELMRVAEGMVKYETTNTHITHVIAPIALADRKVHLAAAERIAREGIDLLAKRTETRRSSFKSDGEFEQAMRRSTAIGHDALGWVLFAQGRLEEAEKELLASYELNHEHRDNLNHLGRFYEAAKDIARAEAFYVRGLAVQGTGSNPSEASLRALYEKRHGGLTGFDTYLDDLKDTDRVRRKEKILATRLATPQPVAPFTLRSLDGKRVSLDSLKGRIVVINFWGIWCGWCVQELADYQKLFEQYANDPAVAILTIDNDKNPDDVPPWMTGKKFTFPVLLDDGYVDKVGIHAFPTTWFLDGQGRTVFEKVGWSEKLLEEFSWRIEAIRKDSPPRSGRGAGR